MTSFGRKAAELIKEVAVSDTTQLPPYNVRPLRRRKLSAPRLARARAALTLAVRAQEQLVAAVKEEANAHYAALLEQLHRIHAQGPAAEAAPEAAANVLVHNRALLRNKRLLLAYVCVSRRLHS